MGQKRIPATEENKTSVPNSLIINKPQKEALSPQQLTFNRLVKKIEKMQAELEKTAHSLNLKMDFYGKNIYPLEERLLTLHKEVTRCLYRFFQDNKLFSRNDKETLGQIISMQLQHILQLEQDEPDDEFKEIFKAVEKMDYDEAAEEDLTGMKREMQSMFEEIGVDIDVEKLHGHMTEEEIMQKIEDLHKQLREQAARREQAPRKKTKRQLEKEAKEKELEEARLKSINSIYKQLVKIFHPDLEQDPELRLEKEELMKKITTSYKSGDLHTLLNLELQWIQQQGNNIDKLTDEKLALYNESLKQQIHDLEEERDQLLHHPRYQALYQYALTPDQIPYIPFNDIRQQKKALIKEMMESLALIQGDQKRALGEIRDIIYSFKNYR